MLSVTATPVECLIPTASKLIYVLDCSKLTAEEKAMLLSLQGIVAKTNPSIFIKTQCENASNQGTNDHLSFICQKTGATVVTKDERGKKLTLLYLINKFSSFVKNKNFVLFDTKQNPASFVVAANLSATESWLAVPKSYLTKIKSLKFVQKVDLTKFSRDPIALQDEYFELYKDKFATNIAIHSAITKSGNIVYGPIDFAIQQGAINILTKRNVSGYSFRRKIMQWLQPCAIIFGQWQDKSELTFVKEMSRLGHPVVHSPYVQNLSYYIGVKMDIPQPKYEFKPITANPNKHYVAITNSDGDSLNYVLKHNMLQLTHQLNESLNIPVSHGAPCISADIAPSLNAYQYDRATDKTSFIAGVSGIGYFNPMLVADNDLKTLCDQTADAMKRAHMSVVTILNLKPKLFEKRSFVKKLGYYSSHDNIAGGILELDPCRYEMGKGTVYFSNGKPFASIRLSLWHKKLKPTKEWVIRQAQKINKQIADIHSVNGYTVVNIHVWSMNAKLIKVFVDHLDKHIELVTAEEILQLMQDNLPHKTASPKPLETIFEKLRRLIKK